MTDYLARCRACELRLCDRCTLAGYLVDHCHTQEQIAEAVGCSQDVVSDVILRETAELPNSVNPAALHQVDFEIPLTQ